MMNGMQCVVRMSFCLGLSLLALAGAGAEPPASTLQWPITEIRLGTPKHPCLFLNQAEVDKIRGLVQVEGTYQQKRFREVMKEVEAWFAKPVSIPAQGAGGSLRKYCPEDGVLLQFNEPPAAHVCPKCGKEYRGEPYDGYWRYLTHNRCGRALNCLGLAYAITGEDRYAAEAARIMVHYAGIYPALPVANCAKLTCEALTEAYFAIDVANAYDLVYNSPAFKAEDKKHVETNLLRSMAELFQYGQWGYFVDRVQGGLSNFNAGLCNGLGAIGFVLGDEALVEFTINGPRGYNRLLAQGVGEDGLWWEGSTAYHSQMVAEFMSLAEMAWHSGINLYTNNNLKKTILLQSRIGFPDGTVPGINDGEFVVSMPRYFAELFYARMGDRDMLRLLVPGKIAGYWRSSGQGLWLTPDWSATPEPAVARESVNSAPNFAVLRSDHAPENQIYLLMDYGPHGGTHGHSDKLQLVLWANGRLEAPDPGTFDYSSRMWGEWYKNSLGHNTIMVDEKPLWPGQGRLNLFQISPRAKIMDASTTSDSLSDDVDFSFAYPFSIPRTRRVVALLDESFVVDIFRVAQVGTVDWVYHNFGDFQPATAMTPLSGILSEKGFGYRHITNVRQAGAAEQFSAIWSRDNQGVKLNTMSDGLTLYAGDGPSPSGRGKGAGDKPMTLLIARATGNVNFQSVIEPFRGAPAITSVKRLEVKPALPNLAGANETGIGLEVNKPDGRHTFMLGYTWWGLKTYGDFQFDGHMAFVSRKSGAGGAIEPQPGYVYMVDGSQLSAADFAIHTGKLTTLWLQKGPEGGFTLGHQGKVPVTVEIQGPNWAGVRVHQLDKDGRPAQEVSSTVRDGAMRWLAAADTCYQIRDWRK